MELSAAGVDDFLSVDFSEHQSLRIEGMPSFIVLCKSNGTAVTLVKGKIRFAMLNLASLTFSISSDNKNMPQVIATTDAALTTS